MENTKQSSGFEHHVTIATSSEDLTMTDQGKSSNSDQSAHANI